MNLQLDAPSGGYLRLQDVAKVEVVAVPNKIEHQDLSRSLDVGANLDGTRDLGSVVADLEEQLEGIDWPAGFRAEVLGEFTELQAASRRLWSFAIVAAIGVFLLLLASFNNGRLAWLVFLTLPIALVGGVIAAYVSGGELSLGSLVGFFTVLGIVARNGIMLVSHYQHLEDEEGMEFGKELVLRGSQERLIPISMTVLTTGLALVPLIIGGSIPGQEIEYPMAIVILGGLITATLLNLLVVPSLYLQFGKSKRTRQTPEAAVASS
jgi:Cu/Ag efflux pump CusA